MTIVSKEININTPHRMYKGGRHVTDLMDVGGLSEKRPYRLGSALA